MTIGDKLLAARQAAGLTQQDIADRIKVTKQTIFKYENGIITNIPIDRLAAIANVLNVDPAVIMGWKEEKPKNEAPRQETTPKHRILFDRSKDLTDKQMDIVLNVVDGLLGKEDDEL